MPYAGKKVYFEKMHIIMQVRLLLYLEMLVICQREIKLLTMYILNIRR